MEDVASWRRLARLSGGLDISVAVNQMRDNIERQRLRGTCYIFVLVNFLSAKGGSVEVVMGREGRNSPLIYDRPASANGGVNVPFLHCSRRFSPLGRWSTGLELMSCRVAAGLAEVSVKYFSVLRIIRPT